MGAQTFPYTRPLPMKVLDRRLTARLWYPLLDSVCHATHGIFGLGRGETRVSFSGLLQGVHHHVPNRGEGVGQFRECVVGFLGQLKAYARSGALPLRTSVLFPRMEREE